MRFYLWFLVHPRCDRNASGKHRLYVSNHFTKRSQNGRVYMGCRWCGLLAAYLEVCRWCKGDGWVDDPTACGDPDHCSTTVACRCNPNHIE